MFINALKAEVSKTKNSGFLYLILIATLFIPLLLGLIQISFPEDFLGKVVETPYMDFVLQCIGSFAPFFYPLLMIIVIARLAQFEHKADAWKLLETQPVQRSVIYFAKWMWALLLALICLLAALIISFIIGYLVLLINKTEGSWSIDFSVLLKAVFKIWLSGLGFMAIQYVLSVRFSNFVIPVLAGVIALIAESILRATGVTELWPYSAPAIVAGNLKGSNFLLPVQYNSVLIMVLALYIGYRFFKTKSFTAAYIKPYSNAISLLALFAVIGLGLYLANQAEVSKRYHQTILAGSITTEQPQQAVYLIDVFKDTIANIPVQKGKFHFQIKDSISTGYYLLNAGKGNTLIYFGNKDSLFIEIKEKDKSYTYNIKGTREPENQFTVTTSTFENQRYLRDYAYKFKPAEFLKKAMNNLENGWEAIDAFKTANNLKPSPDFIALQKKLAAANTIELVEVHYPKIYAVYHPNKKLDFPSSINKLKQKWDINDTTLLFDYSYQTFLADYTKSKASAEGYKNYLQYVNEMNIQPKVKETILSMALRTTINTVKDSVTRAGILEKYLPQIKKDYTKQEIIALNKRIDQLREGKIAPEIIAESLAQNKIALSDLKGRFVVIDFWATWCGPCKKEAPFFEEIAERLTSPNLSFVSISIDDDINDWKRETAGNASSVLQLWSNNKEQLKSYNVEFIPRYVFIDNNGKIINANMPKPSDPEFENIITNELAFLNRY